MGGDLHVVRVARAESTLTIHGICKSDTSLAVAQSVLVQTPTILRWHITLTPLFLVHVHMHTHACADMHKTSCTSPTSLPPPPHLLLHPNLLSDFKSRTESLGNEQESRELGEWRARGGGALGRQKDALG